MIMARVRFRNLNVGCQKSVKHADSDEWCVVVVVEEDRQREVDSNAEFDSISIIPSRGRRIRQLLCLSPTCEFAVTPLCY